MTNFRVEYFNEKENKLEVMFLDAEDSNEVKSLFKEKYSKKGRLSSVCDTKTYKLMLEKYGDLMRPLV